MLELSVIELLICRYNLCIYYLSQLVIWVKERGFANMKTKSIFSASLRTHLRRELYGKILFINWGNPFCNKRKRCSRRYYLSLRGFTNTRQLEYRFSSIINFSFLFLSSSNKNNKSFSGNCHDFLIDLERVNQSNLLGTVLTVRYLVSQKYLVILEKSLIISERWSPLPYDTSCRQSQLVVVQRELKKTNFLQLFSRQTQFSSRYYSVPI